MPSVGCWVNWVLSCRRNVLGDFLDQRKHSHLQSPQQLSAIIFGERGTCCSFLLYSTGIFPKTRIQVSQHKNAFRNNKTLLSHCIRKYGFYKHHRATDSQTLPDPTSQSFYPWQITHGGGPEDSLTSWCHGRLSLYSTLHGFSTRATSHWHVCVSLTKWYVSVVL